MRRTGLHVRYTSRLQASAYPGDVTERAIEIEISLRSPVWAPEGKSCWASVDGEQEVELALAFAIALTLALEDLRATSTATTGYSPALVSCARLGIAHDSIMALNLKRKRVPDSAPTPKVLLPCLCLPRLRPLTRLCSSAVVMTSSQMRVKAFRLTIPTCPTSLAASATMYLSPHQ